MKTITTKYLVTNYFYLKQSINQTTSIEHKAWHQQIAKRTSSLKNSTILETCFKSHEAFYSNPCDYSESRYEIYRYNIIWKLSHISSLDVLCKRDWETMFICSSDKRREIITFRVIICWLDIGRDLRGVRGGV